MLRLYHKYNYLCQPQVMFFPYYQGDSTIFHKGSFLKLTPDSKNLENLLPALGFASCLQVCKANGPAFLAKSGEKKNRGGRGSHNFLQFPTFLERPKCVA